MAESQLDKEDIPVGLESHAVREFAIISGRRSPAQAEGDIGAAEWVVVLDEAGDVTSLLKPADLRRARDAGAADLLDDHRLDLPPTAVVPTSASIGDVLNSGALDIAEAARGLVVVSDHDPAKVIGVIPTAHLAQYVASGRFSLPARAVQGAESEMPGVPLIGALRIRCTCGYVNRFDTMPEGQMPMCQRPGAQHRFAPK